MKIKMELLFNTPDEIQKMDVVKNLGVYENIELVLFGKKINGDVINIYKEYSADPLYHNYVGKWSKMLLKCDLEGKIVDEHQKRSDYILDNKGELKMNEFYVNCVDALNYFNPGWTYNQWKDEVKSKTSMYYDKKFQEMVFFMVNYSIIDCVSGCYSYNSTYYQGYLSRFKRNPNFCIEHIKYFEEYVDFEKRVKRTIKNNENEMDTGEES